MGVGRPRKPAAVKELEGNRSRRDIPAELPLHGTPELPDLDAVASEHFAFLAAEFGGAGVLKRADTPALMKLAQTWSLLQTAHTMGDVDGFCKLSQRWDSAASKLGIQVIDRSRLMIAKPEQKDATEDRFFKVTG
jgi:phage terminase small subunit